MIATMIDYLRTGLYVLLAVLGFLLYQAWDKEHTKSVTASQAAAIPNNNYIPEVTNTATKTAEAPVVKSVVPNNIGQHVIHVSTDVLLLISMH